MNYIVITQRQSKDPYDCDIDILEHSYIQCFSFFLDILLVPLPNDHTSKVLIDNSCGIVLTGGGDINKNQKKRDNLEYYAIKQSIKKRIPLFGICRGMQFIAKYFGGEIYPISGHSLKGKTHGITIEFNGKIWQENVNSYHDYAVSIDNTELKSFAYAKTCIEGLSHPNYLISGVLWHPEREQKQSKISKVILEKFKNEVYNTCSR